MDEFCWVTSLCLLVPCSTGGSLGQVTNTFPPGCSLTMSLCPGSLCGDRAVTPQAQGCSREPSRPVPVPYLLEGLAQGQWCGTSVTTITEPCSWLEPSSCCPVISARFCFPKTSSGSFQDHFTLPKGLQGHGTTSISSPCLLLGHSCGMGCAFLPDTSSSHFSTL